MLSKMHSFSGRSAVAERSRWLVVFVRPCGEGDKNSCGPLSSERFRINRLFSPTLPCIAIRPNSANRPAAPCETLITAVSFHFESPEEIWDLLSLVSASKTAQQTSRLGAIDQSEPCRDP